MRLLVVQPEAERDLEGIWEFIAASDPQAAKGVIDRIYGAVGLLCRTPGVGRPRPDLAGGDHRFFSVRPYLIVYDHDDDFLTVVRVLDGRRDLRRILADP